MSDRQTHKHEHMHGTMSMSTSDGGAASRSGHSSKPEQWSTWRPPGLLRTIKQLGSFQLSTGCPRGVYVVTKSGHVRVFERSKPRWNARNEADTASACGTAGEDVL